jgi:hypothetical protein
VVLTLVAAVVLISTEVVLTGAAEVVLGASAGLPGVYFGGLGPAWNGGRLISATASSRDSTKLKEPSSELSELSKLSKSSDPSESSNSKEDSGSVRGSTCLLLLQVIVELGFSSSTVLEAVGVYVHVKSVFTGAALVVVTAVVVGAAEVVV